MAIGFLEVQLVNAKGLRDTDFFSKIDPYVVIQYKSQERKSSVAQVLNAGAGRNPAWNEKFTFRAEYPGDGNPCKLIFRIMDHDTFSKDDFLGEATVYIEDLLALGVENGTAKIHPRKYRVIGADQTYCGEIQVGLTFTCKAEGHIDEEDFGGWKDGEY